MSAFLDYLNHLRGGPLANAVCLILLLIFAWVVVRVKRRWADEDARERNRRNCLCAHGVSKIKYCRECAAAWVLGAEEKRLDSKGPGQLTEIAAPPPPRYELPELPRLLGEGRAIVGQLTRALKRLAPDSCVRINEPVWFETGVLDVEVVGVGIWQAPSPVDILGMCRAKLRLPGRSYDELLEDLNR